jgi:hypothetical protein
MDNRHIRWSWPCSDHVETTSRRVGGEKPGHIFIDTPSDGVMIGSRNYFRRRRTMIERGYGVVGAQIKVGTAPTGINPPPVAAPVIQQKIYAIESLIEEIGNTAYEIGVSLENLQGASIPCVGAENPEGDSSIEGRLHTITNRLRDISATLVAYRTFLREHIG